MNYYWRIAADMATECEGHQVGENVFHSTATLALGAVCAHSAALEFPALFLSRRPVMVALTAADFPVAVRPVMLPPELLPPVLPA